MDRGHTYSSNRGVRLSIYAPPAFVPPEAVTLTHDGKPVDFHRVSDGSLDCGRVANVTGECTNFECHRRELGKCQCGRHGGVGIRKAADV